MSTSAENAEANYGIVVYQGPKDVIVVWNTPFQFGDSFQYSQGAYAAADKFGVKRNKVIVTGVNAFGGTIQSLIFSLK